MVIDEQHGTHITKADLAVDIVVAQRPAVSPWYVIVCRENSHLEKADTIYVLMEYW